MQVACPADGRTRPTRPTQDGLQRKHSNCVMWCYLLSLFTKESGLQAAIGKFTPYDAVLSVLCCVVRVWQLSPDGRILQLLLDPTGARVATASAATEHNRRLFLGSIMGGGCLYWMICCWQSVSCMAARSVLVLSSILDQCCSFCPAAQGAPVAACINHGTRDVTAATSTAVLVYHTC